MELKEALLLVQLITTIRDTAVKLEQALKEQNAETVERMKKEILSLQKKVDTLV